MSPIGGPGGIGGPSGPKGPGELDGASGPDDVGEVADAGAVSGATAAAGAGQVGVVQNLSAEVAAGRLTAREAIDRLVDHVVGELGEADMGTIERQDLREMLSDLVANDPYLGGLAGRI